MIDTVLVVAGLALAAVVLLPFWVEHRRPKMDDQARVEAPGHFAELSQGITHYRWYGGETGPVVVCVHGLTTPSFVWDPLARRLALIGFRVLVYDLFGRGYSDRPAGEQEDAFFVRQLEDLLADQRLTDDITLFGYSMGGAIAAAFAARHPERLRQLVLIAPAGFGGFPTGFVRTIRDHSPVGDWLALTLFPRRHRQAATALARTNPLQAEAAHGQAAQLDWKGFIPAVLSSLRHMLRDDLEREHRKLAREDLHILAIWATEDDVIPLSGMGRLTQWNRAAVQTQVAGANHWLPLTHPDEIVDAFKDGME
ncbi:putative alpha/beta hydrolase [Pseudooceanicola batsensis HTCC2597]|uniref:Putative alpha/beta hydrolase n=1 Tax=Pseudooceanicola batsensis (strain ATCC BAA-863 / DSM 15984 / KCTC 12145 / HTCC2597) TaxID=252305 RepID=A3TVT8_PSEBH|nr:alpha/beta hydrolase [Pseudooceanicola batsensis]EAQ03734.1 putative alpha/beta hydrolase [Pseudooceanicola batsensis HTCC2597]